jgi:hypothetical protein
MRRFLSVVLSAVAAGAFVVAVSAPVSAAPPWTISPGGNVSGNAGVTALIDTTREPDVVLRCASSRVVGRLDVGSSVDNTLGQVTGVTFTSCVAGLFNFSITALGLPRNVVADPATSTAAVIQGRITGVRSQRTAPACSAVVAGSSATTPGYVTFRYVVATGELTITGGFLRVWNVSGCGGLLVNGHSATFQATYVITPRQQIITP